MINYVAGFCHIHTHTHINLLHFTLENAFFLYPIAAGQHIESREYKSSNKDKGAKQGKEAKQVLQGKRLKCGGTEKMKFCVWRKTRIDCILWIGE